MNREEFTIGKKTDPKFVGAGVWSILFTTMGFVKLLTNKNGYGYLICFAVGGCSLGYLLYLLNKTKENKNERYEDEKKKFISEKSSSMSFNILFVAISVSQFIIERNKIVIKSSFLLLIIMWTALLIKSVTYLICKYKN